MLDSWYGHDTENVNYAQVLLSMNGCNSINDCTKVYNRVYEKYKKYMNSTSQSGHKSFDEGLNCCLNDNRLIMCLRLNLSFISQFIKNLS